MANFERKISFDEELLKAVVEGSVEMSFSDQSSGNESDVTLSVKPFVWPSEDRPNTTRWGLWTVAIIVIAVDVISRNHDIYSAIFGVTP